LIVLAAWRKHLAKVLSGGERRLLEISRPLVMNPQVWLFDAAARRECLIRQERKLR
jgi:ABC-type lipopolysaccharide export system ATPase subunit